MKRIGTMFLCILIIAGLFACSQEVSTWQEQYDLGLRYLDAGKYEEAIIAFVTAIEIDPKQPAAYEKLADAYIAQGNIDEAKNILADGLAACRDDTSLQAKLDELETAPQGEYAEYYTSDLVRPKEMTVGGVPFWQVYLEDMEALYPGGNLIPAGDIPFPQYSVPIYGSNGENIGKCYAGYSEDEMLQMVSYWSSLKDGFGGVSSELRNIQGGQDIASVLLSLGLTKKAVNEISLASNTSMIKSY